MKKTLLTTTALVAALSMGAVAQEDTDTGSADQGTQMQAQQGDRVGNTRPVFEEGSADGQEMAADSEGFYEADTNQILAGNLIGQRVYTGAADDANFIGDVNDIVMTRDGTTRAVVIGVGGFLGMGEKAVAVDFGRLNWSEGDDGERWLTMDTTEEQLENAPAFDRQAVTGDRQAAADDQPQMDGEDQQAATDDQQQMDGEDRQAAADDQQQMDGEDQQAATGDQQQMDAEDQQQAETQNEMTPIENAGLTADDLMGMTVYGVNNDDIGDINDVLIAESGEIEGFVVDVGGFLGLGEKQVAVAYDQVEVVEAYGERAIRTEFTQEELENQTEFDEQAYTSGEEGLLMTSQSPQ